MSKVDPGLHYPLDLESLPDSWEAVYVGDASSEVRSGFASGKHNQDGTGIPHLRPMNVSRGGVIDLETTKYVSPDKDPRRLAKGDVLFNNTNSAELVGKTALVNRDEDWAFSNHMTRVRFDESVDPAYAAHQLHFLWMQGYFLHKCVKHVNQASVSAKALSSTIPLVVAPLPEQRRIVARIEELFSRLDAGVAALRHAKAQLQRYRQSVLAAAVTGQLTQAWREQHPDTEPASELLERVLKQKREQWDGKRKYKEPPTPVTEDLPELPASWTWATVAQQAAPEERAITDGPFGSKLKSSHYTDSGPRVLRLQNIGDGVFKDEYAHISEEHFETLRNHEIFAGDLVIRALGIPAHQACLVPPSVGPAIVKADCIRFKVFEPHINPRLTLFALNSYPVRSRSEKHIHGVGRPRLNGTEIKSIALPLAPLAEQHQIVAEVEARTTAIDHLETELDRQITRSNRLRQSTLATAFTGMLK